MPISIHSDETIIARDLCLWHRGPIAHDGELTLTSYRLFFDPLKKLDRMTGAKELDIDLEHISSISIEKVTTLRGGIDKQAIVRTEGEVYKFSGTGALRIHERLDLQLRSRKGQSLSMAELDRLNERVLLQGDIEVYLKGRLATGGQVVLTQQDLQIDSKKGLETMLFSKKSLHCSIGQVKKIRYEQFGRRLSIESSKGQITIAGKLVPKLFLMLSSLRDGDFNPNRPLFSATLFQGMIALKGYMIASAKRLLFCPTETFDSFTGSHTIAIPIDKIAKVEITGWPERRISIAPIGKKKLLFGTQNPVEDMQSLIGTMSAFKKERLFPDLRHGKINKEHATQLLSQFGVTIEGDKLQLLEWSVYVQDENCFHLGWLLLSKQSLKFISLEQGLIWFARVKDISLAKNSRENDPIMRLVYGSEKKTFIPHGGGYFGKTMWGCIFGIQPQLEAEEGRSGQSVRNIIGSFIKCSVFRDNVPILEINNVDIVKRPRGLRIMTEKKEQNPFKEGDVLEFEVPRNEGRFRFFAEIRENYLTNPDPIGRYYFTFSLPTDISVFNQRSAFRVSFKENTTIEVYEIEEDQTYDYFHLIKELYLPTPVDEEERKDLERMNPFDRGRTPFLVGKEEINFFDISLGGCSFNFKQSLEKRCGLDKSRIFLKIRIPFEKQALPILAQVRNIRPHSESNMYIVHGCEFINLHRIALSTLRNEVLRLEREQIRELIRLEEQARRMGLL
jgi:hypothetical protein